MIIFDFDGTIADSLDLVVTQYNRLAPRFGTKPVDREQLARLRRLRAGAAMREQNVALWKLPFLVRAMRRAMHDHVEALLPCAGVPEALHALRAAGLRCGVLSTNSNANIERFLAQHELRVFERIAGGASMFGKARALRSFLARASLRPEQVLYVGDEVRDVEAAQAAGVRSVAVSWGFADRDLLLQQGPTYLVDRPSELVMLLGNPALDSARS